MNVYHCAVALRSTWIVIGMVLLLGGCSATSGGYPTVLESPPQRADTKLTPDEVKQATDTLVTQRDQLNATSTTPPPAPAAKKQPAKSAATKQAAPSGQAAQAGAQAGAQTGGQTGQATPAGSVATGATGRP